MFKRGLSIGVLTFLCLIFLAGTVGAGKTISITGSTTVEPIAKAAGTAFEKANPGIKVTVKGSGSGDGVKAIILGKADIGNASRDVKSKEAALAKAKGVELVKHVVALDCIVPIVHPSNPITQLTMDQLKAVYNGQITNWKKLGGPDKPIVVISRDSKSGTFGVWRKLVMKKKKVLKTSKLAKSNGSSAKQVAADEAAIGYVGISYVKGGVKGLSVNEVEASAKTAADGSYPISRKLYMITGGQPQGAVKAYLDFVKSGEGQKIVEAKGFVPLP